jgi:hypothetical protein
MGHLALVMAQQNLVTPAIMMDDVMIYTRQVLPPNGGIQSCNRPVAYARDPKSLCQVGKNSVLNNLALIMIS